MKPLADIHVSIVYSLYWLHVYMCIYFKFTKHYSILFRKPFSDPSNQGVVKRLVQEVTSLDSTIPLLQIRGKYTCRILMLHELFEYGNFSLKVENNT